MRQIDFQFKLLRNGADYGFLNAIGAPSIRCENEAAIKTSFSGTFKPNAYDADGNEITYDFFSDEIQPVMILDGVEHPLGVFLPATVTPSEENGVTQVSVEAYDRCWLLRDTVTETLLFFAQGASYIDTIETLLTQAGITTVLATASAATFAEDREDWEIGTSYLDIINQLLSEINYNQIWFNSEGIAILEPASVPTAANIEHILDADKIDSLLIPSITRETDLFQAPNVWLCICDNPDKSGIMTATSENTNPQSPLSIARRGRRIVHVETLQNIANQTELQAYADRLRNESLTSGERITVGTALLPNWGVADVTALHWGDLSAVCIEQGWTMDLEVGGNMTHLLERVVYALE